MNPCGVPPQGMFISTHPNIEQEMLFKYINDLSDPTTRENALQELNQRRINVADLGPMLWFSFGAVAVILKEIVNTYPAINPPTLTAVQSHTVCNALALLQCIASHNETRGHFLAANIPLFLYPFLNAHGISRPIEYLRLTSLGVIGALVGSGEREVITYLLQTEIIPLCLKVMDNNCELSKIVATFIMQKILLDDKGLVYICETYERFSLVARALGNMALNIAREPPSKNKSTGSLLKHIIRCFLRLTENSRARKALHQCIPEPLINGTFFSYLDEKDSSTVWLSQLVRTLEPLSAPAPNVDERSYGI